MMVKSSDDSKLRAYAIVIQQSTTNKVNETFEYNSSEPTPGTSVLQHTLEPTPGSLGSRGHSVQSIIPPEYKGQCKSKDCVTFGVTLEQLYMTAAKASEWVVTHD